MEGGWGRAGPGQAGPGRAQGEPSPGGRKSLSQGCVPNHFYLKALEPSPSFLHPCPVPSPLPSPR